MMIVFLQRHVYFLCTTISTYKEVVLPSYLTIVFFIEFKNFILSSSRYIIKIFGKPHTHEIATVHKQSSK